MTSCVHLDIALLLVIFTAALTGLRFLRVESPNADLMVDALNRLETGPLAGEESVSEEKSQDAHQKA